MNGEHDRQEDIFRKFSNKLLAAEYPIDPVDRRERLHSRKALKTILDEFCEIIAEALNVESCTVHLKLYDPGADPFKQKEGNDWRWDVLAPEVTAKDKINEIGLKHFGDDVPSAWNELRKRTYESPLAFPYPFFPKGALQLVGSNYHSPWKQFCHVLLSDLQHGITQDVIQDKVARVRDRYRMRLTRGMKKFGSYDPYAWTNAICLDSHIAEGKDYDTVLPWLSSFFNYYGVPIRIQPGGDVIGLLRVENKGLFTSKDLGAKSKADSKGPGGRLRKVLKLEVQKGVDEIGDQLYRELCGGPPDGAQSGPDLERISFFALAYLIEDVADFPKKSLKELCSIPHPAMWPMFKPRTSRSKAIRLDSNKGKPAQSIEDLHKSGSYGQFKDLLSPGLPKRPPVQIAFMSMEDENCFLSALRKTNDNDSGKRWCWEGAKEFYRCLNRALADADFFNSSGTITSELKRFVEKALDRREMRVECPVDKKTLKLEHAPRVTGFTHVARLEFKNVDMLEEDPKRQPNKHVYLFLTVLPSSEDLLTGKPEFWELDKEQWKLLKLVNPADDKAPPTDRIAFAGEMVMRKGEANCQVPHLLSDRLAARICSLTYCFPIPDFDLEDARRLSWASLQIGKLIERQISYRGNQGTPKVPLTAVDFHRLPISDLSFVDSARQQYKRAEDIQRMLKYHVRNLCVEMGFDTKKIALDSYRIKDFRSYFERLGAAYENRRRALIVVWGYFLSELLGKIPTGRSTRNKRANANSENRESLEAVTFLKKLAELKHWTKEFAAWHTANRHSQLSENVAESAVFLNSKCHLIYGDVYFLSPPFYDHGNRNAAFNPIEVLARNICIEAEISPKQQKSSHQDDYVQAVTERLADLVLRRYDPYLAASISLFVQLLNARNFPKYGTLYQACYDMVFAIADQDTLESFNRDRSGSDRTGRGLEEILQDLESYCMSTATEEFVKTIHRIEKESHRRPQRSTSSDYTTLTAPGIFKRIRMLYNVLGNQLPPELLNWHARRFDYVGARLTCLFKTQVFACYEQIWNSGDPFFRFDTSHKCLTNTDRRLIPNRLNQFLVNGANQEDVRQRWLCLRTKVHEGEDGYFAWQIVSLADPNALRVGHWTKDVFTLSTLRDYLGWMYHKLDRANARNYKKFALLRNYLRLDYLFWFKQAEPLLRDETIEPSALLPAPGLATGEYCGGAALDVLVWLITAARASAQNDQPELADWISWHCREIASALKIFCRASVSYSEEVSASLGNMGDKVTLGKFKNRQCVRGLEKAATKLYKTVRKLLSSRTRPLHAGKRAGDIKRALKMLEIEQKRFADAYKRDLPVRPLIFISEKGRSIVKKAIAPGGLLAALETNRCPVGSGIRIKSLEELLVLLQREQAMLVFEEINGLTSGRQMRDQRQVMHRIFNYALLYDSNRNGAWHRELRAKQKDKTENPQFAAWTAYDLFYYLISLVPSEIQIRTAISDTVAEQYHGIYKTEMQSKTGAAVHKWRMQEIGRKFEEVDRETEIQFEGFVTQKLLERSKDNPID